ncbi:MAG: hypothetical protein ACK5Q5_01415 [Planctomycetaceae bacterium]
MRIPSPLLEQLVAAQSNLFGEEFKTAFQFVARVLDDLKVASPTPKELGDQQAEAVADLDCTELVTFWSKIVRQSNVPRHAIPNHAVSLAQHAQLLRAFSDPATAVEQIRVKVAAVVQGFPREATDIECGRNPGDILDPYILAATQYLVCGGDFSGAIEHTVSHKTLMMIEGLLGHLHEDVIGLMRGNVRVPEPRGKDQETISPESNPFPGADLVQPPWDKSRSLRFQQIKSKTGSAKGGDGRRLGEQLQRLRDLYGGDIFYHALIGNTLRGHRSKGGVERAAEDVVVLVGESSFRELTGSNQGPQLLLRVYQAAFQEVADESGYTLDSVAAGIVETFRQRSEDSGEGFLETMLEAAIGGPASQQDNRMFGRSRPQR